jgi:ribonuclease HII
VCAVLVRADTKPVDGVTDSKKLPPGKRETIAKALLASPDVKYALASVPANEIDSRGIVDALRWCFREAIGQLIAGGAPLDTVIQIDGEPIKGLTFPREVEYIVRGDAKVWAIGAASIIAKVHRDAYMKSLFKDYPAYGWIHNSGYGTAGHMAAIALWGLTPLHRKTFCRAFVKPQPLKVAETEAASSIIEDLFG